MLLSGSQGLGKTSLVEAKIHELLGFFATQDYLPLYDLSVVLGKKHSFKVAVSDKEQAVQ